MVGFPLMSDVITLQAFYFLQPNLKVFELCILIPPSLISEIVPVYTSVVSETSRQLPLQYFPRLSI